MSGQWTTEWDDGMVGWAPRGTSGVWNVWSQAERPRLRPSSHVGVDPTSLGRRTRTAKVRQAEPAQTEWPPPSPYEGRAFRAFVSLDCSGWTLACWMLEASRGFQLGKRCGRAGMARGMKRCKCCGVACHPSLELEVNTALLFRLVTHPSIAPSRLSPAGARHGERRSLEMGFLAAPHARADRPIGQPRAVSCVARVARIASVAWAVWLLRTHEWWCVG